MLHGLFLWQEQGRRDLAAETQHRERAEEDYAILRSLGIAVALEGIHWPLVELGGYFDFCPYNRVALSPLRAHRSMQSVAGLNLPRRTRR
jgi:hypothetical protein